MTFAGIELSVRYHPSGDTTALGVPGYDRRKQARYQMDEVFRLDPFNPAYRCFRSWRLPYDGEYEAAIANALNVISVEPEFPAAHLALYVSGSASGAVTRLEIADLLDALSAA